ncbi:MAG: peptidoglycan-binding domain-containing protein [Minisyncoccia bacterium]
MKSLFPPYLNIGSQGPAVVVLQIILRVLGYNSYIVPDGDYGGETVKGVKDLQSDMGIEVDGNFGPGTRKAFLEAYSFDVDTLDASKFLGDTVAVVPDGALEVEVEE